MVALVYQLKQQGGKLLDGRGTLLSLWQELASNFYPQRADFTVQRQLGAEFASDLMTSFPLIVHRDLANSFSAMLRPTAKDWFKTKSKRMDRVDTEGKQWLEWFTALQKRAMYDRPAQLSKATKEADNDYALTGQTVIQCRYHRPRDGAMPHLHHRCWHLRDCAWTENALGSIDTFYRRAHEQAVDLVQSFPKVHADIERDAKEQPFEKHEIWHCVLPRYLYDSLDGSTPGPHPFVSIYFDPKHEMILEETGAWVFEYVIPRWSTVSGSQYAYSPATIAALPDGRLIQSVARILLESGELAIYPTMIGVREAIRSDIDIRAGGFIAVDAEYDERLGEVLRPLTRDTKGLSFGHELIKDIREQLTAAFYLNKLNLPPTQESKEMTAFEVGQRVQEFIRNALPLFEPMESEYNGQLCDIDMQLILRNNPDIVQGIPDSLRGPGFEFSFESPLREAIDKQKIGQFQEAAQILTAAQALDPSAAFIIDGKTAVRDVLEAATPAKWLRPESVVDKMVSNAQAQQKQQQLLSMLGQGGKAAKDLAAAGSDAAGAMQQLGPA